MIILGMILIFCLVIGVIIGIILNRKNNPKLWIAWGAISTIVIAPIIALNIYAYTVGREMNGIVAVFLLVPLVLSLGIIRKEHRRMKGKIVEEMKK